jgi:hypothetical protein
LEIRKIPKQNSRSVLFVTLDSCRYDTFAQADAPNLKAVGKLHRAMAPGNFTYASHAAMFVGFTPGIAGAREAFVNPKFAKIFRMATGGIHGKADEFAMLSGRNIIDGFNRLGYSTVGSAAVGWFDPATETGALLSRDFGRFHYQGSPFSLALQLDWLSGVLAGAREPVFVFLNVGETHVPYWHEGADWDPGNNPCVPFSEGNDAEMCGVRQKACLEYVDRVIGPLITAFSASTVLICADHGDCWGEDGLWEHGISHAKVLEVPLLFRLGDPPGSAVTA